MILEIRLSNVFSINEEIVLDLKAANIRTKTAKDLSDNTFNWNNINLLKSVVIYGANASGKSNIVKAIRGFCSLVLNSHNFNENSKFNIEPFKFGSAEKPSTFSISFVINQTEYEYSVSVLNNKIHTESLYFYPKGRKSLVFSRDEHRGNTKEEIYTFPSIPKIKKPKDIALNTSNKTLFISRASQMDRPLAQEVFRFFNEQFILGYLPNFDADIEWQLNNNKAFILSALQAADSDIVNIEYEKRVFTGKSFSVNLASAAPSVEQTEQENVQLVLKTYHRANPTIAFDFNTEESDGTKKLFFIILRLISIIKQNKILLVDEIDEKLHPKLLHFVVQSFHASDNSQLICTTHNTSLLDFKKLRKDQIYFTDKNKEAATELFSLFDFKDFRENQDPEKNYLMGRFSGVPYIDEDTQAIKELLHG